MCQGSASSPSESALYEAGAIIADKYRLERLLGEGGQGCVWEARNVSLDVDVAIKFVPPAAGNSEQIARLLLEAQTAARLHHPAIVRVFDFGQTPRGDSFLVMELLEGESLAQLLETSERLTPEYALRLLLPVAEAVGMAHESGVVHRDLKPDNIFLSCDEGRIQPKLLDFGLVRVQNTTDVARRLTCANAIVGTPAYLSPEQARGETNIDHRSDIWAFSATLYECITGRLPFSASTSNALLWTIVESRPVPTTELGVGDAALWAIIERGLAKSREERWPSMLDLGRALGDWLVSHGFSDDVLGVPLSSRWRAHAGTPAPALCTLECTPQSELEPSSTRVAESVIPVTTHLTPRNGASHAGLDPSSSPWRPTRTLTTLAIGFLSGALALFAARFQGGDATEAFVLAKRAPHHTASVAAGTAPRSANAACVALEQLSLLPAADGASSRTTPIVELATASPRAPLAGPPAQRTPNAAQGLRSLAHRANHAKSGDVSPSGSEERAAPPPVLEAPDAELMAAY